MGLLGIILAIAGLSLIVLILVHLFKTRNKNTLTFNLIKLLGELVLLVLLPILGFIESNEPCQEHPFELNSYPSAVVLYALPLFCYFISAHFKAKVGPIILALLPLGLVVGLIYCIVLTIHFGAYMLLAVFPVLGLPLLAPLVAFLYLLVEFFSLHKYQQEHIKNKTFTNTSLQSLSQLFLLPVWQKIPVTILLSAPILALMQFILTLFGQVPDSMISMFTESCGFLLSNYQDCNCGGDHYLCSIAANGNTKLVKPTRLGWRKNEKILVNRQLLIANAFENWMEERVPKIHRIVRNTYDAMEIPVNKWAKDKNKANMLYLVMKPIEWLFLAWLYCFDTKPESRIAIQYLPKDDFETFKNQMYEYK